MIYNTFLFHVTKFLSVKKGPLDEMVLRPGAALGFYDLYGSNVPLRRYDLDEG